MNGLNVGKQLTDSIASLRTTLGSVTDTTTAQAALPKLQDVTAQIDGVDGLIGQMTPGQRKLVAGIVNPLTPLMDADRPRRPERETNRRQTCRYKSQVCRHATASRCTGCSRAPGDAAAFKGWLRQISQHVAEAATEGGFLGIGGVAVSETEKATPAEISGALGLQG